MTCSTAGRRAGGDLRPARRARLVVRLGSSQRGMVTVETALAIPALLLAGLLAMGLSALVGAQIACADAARDAALAIARDMPDAHAAAAVRALAPQGAELSISRQPSLVEVTVRAQVRPAPGPLGRLLAFSVSARSTALRESAGLP